MSPSTLVSIVRWKAKVSMDWVRAPAVLPICGGSERRQLAVVRVLLGDGEGDTYTSAMDVVVYPAMVRHGCPDHVVHFGLICDIALKDCCAEDGI